MSPQTRRGRAVPDGHRKTSPRPATHIAAPKAPQPSPKAAQPNVLAARSTAEDPDADLREPSEVAAESAIETDVAPKAPAKEPRRGASKDARTVGAASLDDRRVRRRAAQVRRSPLTAGFMGYFRAYLPLLAAFIVLFAGVWFYNSFAPHTLSPAENWQRIANKWKTERDDARARVQAAAADNDLAGQMAAYKDLATYTQGWMTDIAAVGSWDDSSHTADQNTQTDTAMDAFKQDGGNLVDIVNTITSAGTLEALQQNSADLVTTDDSFSNDFRELESDILGASSLVSPVATLNVPTAPPSAEASASAEASGSAGPSGSPEATASVEPSASPSASIGPSPSLVSSASPTQ